MVKHIELEDGIVQKNWRSAEAYMQRNKGKAKAKPSVDFEILHIGLCDAVICTRLPVKEAIAKLNRESPSGVSHRWEFDGKASNQSPCPDGQGKTHYRLFC